ncbi:MAG: tetratricopeptide repeat protein [Fimbriimonadales bacterium]|nr:tetratricopeptide repeat protein [Fimbriimonadales bacterium]
MQDDFRRWLEQGQGLIDAGRYADAEAALRRAVALAPENADVQLALGVALARQERWEEAIAALEQATRLNPNSVAAWRNLGYCYYRMRYLEAAIPYFQRSLALQPDQWESHLLLGLIHAESVRLEPMVEHLEAALRYSTDETPRARIYGMLAFAYEMLEQPEQANRYRALAEPAESDEPTQGGAVEHFLYFPSYEQAQQAAEAYRTAGFDATLLAEADDPDAGYCVLVVDATPSESDEFDRVIEQLEQIAAPFGGEYDGYGYEA